MVNILRNVFGLATDRNTFLYLFPLAILIFLLNEFFEFGIGTEFVTFSIFVWLWSTVIFQILEKPLKSESVDIWYYSLGMIAISIAFTMNYPSRASIEFDDTRFSSSEASRKAEFEIELLNSIKQNPNFFSTQAYNKYLEIFNLAKLGPEACSESEVASKNLQTIRSYNLLSHEQIEPAEKPDVDEVHLYCEKIAFVANHNISFTSSPLEMMDRLARTGVDDEVFLHMAGRMYFLNDIFGGFRLIKPGQDLADFPDMIVWLEQHKKYHDRVIDGVRSMEIVAEIESRKGSLLHKSVSRFNFMTWPFMLIAALGLKLARNRYDG